jgi:hypothetical protein
MRSAADGRRQLPSTTRRTHQTALMPALEVTSAGYLSRLPQPAASSSVQVRVGIRRS